MKYGYPPQNLALIPELPISSLGLKPGEQLIVNENTDGASRVPINPPSKAAASAPTAPRVTPSTSSALPKPKSDDPESVPTEGGVLMHRVRDFGVQLKSYLK